MRAHQHVIRMDTNIITGSVCEAITYQEGRQVSQGQHVGAFTPTHTFTSLSAVVLLILCVSGKWRIHRCYLVLTKLALINW